MDQRVNVLGVGVSAINMDLALARIRQAVEKKEKGYVCVTGVHGVSEAQSDPGFRQILNRSFLCTPDGMPLVWAGRMQGQKQMARVYGPDLMLAVMELSEQDRLAALFLRRGGWDGQDVARQIAGAVSEIAGGRNLRAPLPAAERGRAGRPGGTNSLDKAGPVLGGFEHAQTGALHGGVSAQAGCHLDVWSGRGF